MLRVIAAALPTDEVSPYSVLDEPYAFWIISLFSGIALVIAAWKMKGGFGPHDVTP